MKVFAVRYPLLFAVTVSLAGLLSLLWPLWVPGWSVTVQVLLGRITSGLLAVGLLTRLGWWREAGFVRPASWRTMVPFLPLLLLVLLGLVTLAASGIRVNGWEMILVGLVTYGLGGFFEEAIFRGLVLRALRPGGIVRAAVLMAVIFGAVHAANLLGGADPQATALQVISAALIGLAFVGPLVYTGNIWPLVFIHGLNNFVGYLAAGGFLNTAATSVAPTSVEWVVSLVVPLPLALYALWLVHRAGREADQVRWNGLLPQG